jgi:RimK-like ATP-grasp domain
MMIKIISKILAFFYGITRVNWFKAFARSNSKAENVLWMIPCWPRFWKYNKSYMVGDFAHIRYFHRHNIPYKIVIGKSIGKYTNKNIFYTISRLYNPYQLHNWAANMLCAVKELEDQGNTLFASYKEAQYWENKVHMHKMFAELGINHPKTWVFERGKQINLDEIPFPVLYKDVHTAGSIGMKKINNRAELDEIIALKHSQGIYTFLIQELINMRKDLRVIIIGDEIVLHYWRVNNDKDWKPTATSGGSKVDFVTFPEQWRSHIMETFKRLQIRTGAFDITWQNDDLSTEPLYLEISPSYMPNPRPNEKYKDAPYSAFKKDLFCKDPYFKKVVDILLEEKEAVIDLYFKDIQAGIKR